MKTLLAAGRGTQVLLAVLGLQLLLAAVLYWQSTRSARFSAAEELFSLDQAAVDLVQISDGEKQLRLSRSGQDWHIEPGQDLALSLPADSTQVSTALETLTSLSAGLPVATTEAAQEQLEVADERYQRQLTLFSGENSLLEIYLGSSPGFRKAHMRKAGDQAIYAARINVFDLPVEADDWLDKNLLALKDISSISGDDFSLHSSDGTWSLSEPVELPAGMQLDTARVEALLASLTDLRVDGVGQALEAPAPAATAEAASAGAVETPVDALVDSLDSDSSDPAPAEETLQRKVLRVGNGQQELTFTFELLGDEATVRRDDIDAVFSLGRSSFDKLGEFSLEKLLSSAAPVQDSQSSASGEQSASPAAAGGASNE